MSLKHVLPLLFFPLLVTLVPLTAAPKIAETSAKTMRVMVYDEVLNTVDARLFGQFMERATWGEPGPESAYVPKAPYLQPKALEMLKEMEIRVIRFPGGTDIDYIDWRDMIDNVPGRSDKGRPVTVGHQGDELTNQFGYDEYFAVRDALGSETILVLNLMEAVLRKKPLGEAARDAVGLVAYTNAPAGADLPEDMPDWAMVRAQNGHEAVYAAEFVQLGNELWHGAKKKQLEEAMPDATEAERAEWITECVREYVRLIRAIDSEIQIMIDDTCVFNAHELYLKDPYIREQVAYAAYHSYAPWRVNRLRIEGQDVPFELLSPKDWWIEWTSMPGHYDESTGLVLQAGGVEASQLGYKVAVTEWNWNGWVQGTSPFNVDMNYVMASGLGAAGFLHGMMRNGDRINVATQSMVIGSSWKIAAVQVDPDGVEDPYYVPQGQVARLYSRNHGDELIALRTEGIPILHVQPDGYVPQPKGALVDVVVTRDAKTLFVHLIHRGLRNSALVDIDLSAVAADANKGRLKSLLAQPFASRETFSGKAAYKQVEAEVVLTQPIELAPASVSVLEIPIR